MLPLQLSASDGRLLFFELPLEGGLHMPPEASGETRKMTLSI